MTLRVSMVSSLPPQRGITPYTVELLRALAYRRDVEVDAVGFKALYPRFIYPGGSSESVAEPSPLSVAARRPLSWYDPFSWIRTGLTLQSDVVHLQWWSWVLAAPYLTLIATERARGRPVVVTAHNVRPHEGSKWRALLNDAVIRASDHVIVHSKRNMDALVAGGMRPDVISVVPMGIHPVPGTTVTREDARARLGIAPGAKVVLLFGNVRPYKGASVLLEAASTLIHSIPGLRIVIAGDQWRGGGDLSAMIARTGTADVVTVRPGFVPDAEVSALFAAADAAVLPYTHFDGQSAVGALSLAARRALIVSDVGGLPELVRDPRAMVPPGDAAALARALAGVLTDDALRHSLEANASEVAQQMSWSTVAEKTVAVYAALPQARDDGVAVRRALGRGNAGSFRSSVAGRRPRL